MGTYEEWKEALEEKAWHTNVRKTYIKTSIQIHTYILNT